jgi:hypothetical protein
VLPEPKRVRNARLLRAGQPLDLGQTGKIVEFTIPQLNEYEVAVFES